MRENMKKCKVVLAASLILGASVLFSHNTFAAVYIYEDERPVSTRIPNNYEERERMHPSSFIYTVKYLPKAQESNQASESNVVTQESEKNPETFDDFGIVFVSIVLAAFVFVLLIMANMRKRGSVKPYYFGLFFGILAMATAIMFASSKESFAAVYTPIKNRDLYNAIKSCFSKTDYSRTEFHADDLPCLAEGNYGYGRINFDDDSMSISRADTIVSLKLNAWETGIKLSDISELTKFPNLEFLDLANNDISDASMLNKDNFPHLDTLYLFNNHIDNFNDELWELSEYEAALYQTLSYVYDEDGTAPMPPSFSQIMNHYRMGYNFPVFTYNLEISEDYSSVRILDTNKEAYIRIPTWDLVSL